MGGLYYSPTLALYRRRSVIPLIDGHKKGRLLCLFYCLLIFVASIKRFGLDHLARLFDKPRPWLGS